MVASMFLEISSIRCPQKWRLILGHLSSEKKGDPGWVGPGGWSKTNKFVREKGFSNAKVVLFLSDSKEDGNMP